MQNLRKIREAAKMSAVELAGRVGVSPATINYLETRNGNTTCDKLCAIADALGCTTDALLGRNSPDTIIAPVEVIDYGA